MMEQKISVAVPHIKYNELNIGTLLGEGGYGKVYKAVWQGIDVAIKQLHLKNLSEDLIEDFKQETAIMAQCQFTNIVNLYGVCMEPGHYSIVMEYMPKGSLYHVLHNSNNQLSWLQRYNIAIDIGKGIAFLHAKNIIHRDLKSLNILLDNKDTAKITDFGLSKIKLETSTSSNKHNKVIGSTRWMAPELLDMDEPSEPNKPSDIYSYGMVLWEIAARKIPFEKAKNETVAATWIMNGKKEVVPEDVHAPIEYSAIIKKTWSMPEKRPTALEVVKELELSKPQEIKIKPEEKNHEERSWHFDSTTERKTATELENETKEYGLFPATDKDTKKVIDFYQHHPVPGYEIGKVQMIYNKTFNQKFALELRTLQQKQGNPGFESNWHTMSEPEWRKETYALYEKLAAPYTDPDYPNVKLIPAWHGTDSKILDSLFRIGYEDLATTDLGFFGKGLYSAWEAEYSWRVYAKKHKENAALILNWTASFSALPVIDGDMPLLKGKAKIGSYDANFVPVVPKNPLNPNEQNYYPCKPGQKNVYTEIVVFQTAACLPRYLVELQVTNLKSPSMTVIPTQPQVIQQQLQSTQKQMNQSPPKQTAPKNFFQPAPDEKTEEKKIIPEKIIIEKPKTSYEKVTEQANAISKQINPQEVAALLKWVAEGNLDEAEKLLQKNKHLALAQGDVKDLSDRIFKNITAFQLAVWYLDSEMWDIILKYLDKTQAAYQFDALQNHRPDITNQYGKQFDFEPLLKAYQTYIANYLKWNLTQRADHWCKQIGGEQRKVPAWYMYAFCEEGKDKAWREKNFSLTVTREVDKNHALKWNSTIYNSGICGDKFGFLRADMDRVHGEVPLQDTGMGGLRNIFYEMLITHDQSNTQLLKLRQKEQLSKLQSSLFESVKNEMLVMPIQQQLERQEQPKQKLLNQVIEIKTNESLIQIVPQNFFQPAPEEKIIIEKKFQNPHEKVTEQAQLIFNQVNVSGLNESLKQQVVELLKQGVNSLLKFVTEGNLREVEKLLQKNKDFASAQGDVKDLSGREFKNVTAFQLTIFYLDNEMWELILKYLDKSQAALQFDALQNNRPDITNKYGKYFDFDPLITAYKTYIDNYSKEEVRETSRGSYSWISETSKKCIEHWSNKIGGEQCKIPAWCMYALSEEGRSVAWVTGDFTKKINREVDKNHATQWNANSYLGKQFAYTRGTDRRRNINPPDLKITKYTKYFCSKCASTNMDHKHDANEGQGNYYFKSFMTELYTTETLHPDKNFLTVLAFDLSIFKLLKLKQIKLVNTLKDNLSENLKDESLLKKEFKM